MPSPDHAAAFASLGEDLLLLSIHPQTGKLMTAGRISYGLMGSELVRLAATGRIDIVCDQIVVRNPAATGDAELDAALLSLVGARRPPRPDGWVGLPRRGIRNAYLDRLVSVGLLRVEPSAVLGTRRYRITAPERVAAARSRLDAIAQSAGPLPVAQTAFGGLACAIDLDNALYPGRAGRPWRARLEQIARGDPAARAARAVGSGSGSGSGREAAGREGAAAGRAGGATGVAGRQAAADAAQRALTDAALDGAADAIAQVAAAAAISAAASAAVHAATAAAINGAQSVGGHGAAGQGDGGSGSHGGGHAGGGHAGGHH
jgi:hypothetical protein